MSLDDIAYSTGFSYAGQVAHDGWRLGPSPYDHWTPSVTTSSARYTGQRNIQPAISIARPRRYIDGLGETATLGFSVRYTNTTNTHLEMRPGFCFYVDGEPFVGFEFLQNTRVWLNATNDPELVIEEAWDAISVASWRYFELTLHLHPTDGYITVRHHSHTGSVQEHTVSGIDTRRGTTGDIEAVGIGTVSSENYHRPLAFGDIYVTRSARRLGDCRVRGVRPSAQGFHDQWDGYQNTFDPVATDKHLLVNNLTPDKTNYVQSLVNGNRQSFEYENLTADASWEFVAGVRRAVFAHSPTPTDERMDLFVRDGGVDLDDADPRIIPESAEYSNVFDSYDPLDPAGDPWTLAKVNALEFGVRKLDPGV